jgi:hypothetical protein
MPTGLAKGTCGVNALPYAYAVLRVWIVPPVHSPGFPPKQIQIAGEFW